MNRSYTEPEHENASTETQSKREQRARDGSDAPADSVAALHRASGNRAVQSHVENARQEESTPVSEPTERQADEDRPVERAENLCPRCLRRFRAGKPLNCRECEDSLVGQSDSVESRPVTEPSIQPKLMVSDPDDEYEREADRVAERVMREPDASRRVSVRGAARPDGVQRACSRCRDRYRNGLPLDCEECGEALKHKETSGGAAAVDAETRQQIQALRGGGRPLPESARSFFEPRFGENFRGVRIHTGRRADEAARSIDAKAFTIGTDVVFRSSAHRPGTDEWTQLLAHELTHVVQHRRGTASETRIGRIPDEDGVRERRYSYSTNCGWIDWGHTNPGLARQLIAVVREASQRIGRREAELSTGVERSRSPLVTETSCPWQYEADERTESGGEAPVTHFNESGEYVEIHVGGFGVNSRDSSKFQSLMQSVATTLLAFQSMRQRSFEVIATGFSDCVGSDERNAELRDKRATEIGTRLLMAVRRASDQAEVTLSFSDAPLNEFLRSNATRKGRRFNRGARVELVPQARPEEVQTPQMASRAPVVGTVSGVTPTISLERSLSEDEVRKVALSVFMIQSQAFESLQGWTDVIAGSSFSEEDLPSNLISFYRAAEGYSSVEVREICDAWDEERSLEKLEGYNFTRNRSFKPPNLPPGGQWPQEFESITPAAPGSELFRVVELFFETPILDRRCTVRDTQLDCR